MRNSIVYTKEKIIILKTSPTESCKESMDASKQKKKHSNCVFEKSQLRIL